MTGRDGVALVLVVLLLLALQLLAHGSLVLARQELSASKAGGELLQARIAAEAGLNETLPGNALPADTVGLWSGAVVASGSFEGAWHQTRVRRLARELWVLEGWGQVERRTWRLGLGRMIWIMDPVQRLLDFPGVIQVGSEAPLDVRGEVDGSGMAPARSAPDPRCAPFDAALDSLFLGRTLPAVARDTTLAAFAPALGMLGPAELASRLGAVGSVTGTPSPSESLGRCATEDPWNWGDPTRPDRPCGTHWMTGWAPGGLRLVGGVGQGLLAVAGDLELSGTRFDGVLLVGGRLLLVDGAELVGLAQAAGGVTVDSESWARGSACPPVLALNAARTAVGGPLPIPGG